MLGRMIVGGQPLTTISRADFIVNSDADWDAVFTANADTLSGKVIEIRGANFSPRTIANKDMASIGAPLTIRSADAASSLPSITVNGTVRGIDFSGLNFQMTGWPKVASGCFVFNNGTFGALRFLNGTTFRHGYSAGLTDINTASNLPEYARINNIQTATTTSATFPLMWNDSAAPTGWIEFFNRGTNPVRVAVGGAGIVATGTSTLAPAGARTRISSLSPGTATHFAILATTGTSQVNARTEIGLSEYLADAFSGSGSAVVEDIEIRNCLFRDVQNGVKNINPTSMVVMDCDFDRIYQDVISFAPKVGGFAYLLRNLECLPFARSGIPENENGDARDPHGDQFQMFSNNAGTLGPIYYAGNRVRIGNLRPDVSSQGVLLADNEVVPSYTNLYFVSTMQVGGAPIGMTVGETSWPVRDSFIYGTTIVDWRDAADPLPRITIASSATGTSYLGSTITPNLTEFVSPVARDGVLLLSAAASRTAVFPNLPALATARTREAIEAAITPAAEGFGLGAVAAANALDWTISDYTQVIRWENLPSGAHWNALTQQPLNTAVVLPLRKIQNRRPAQTVTVGAGTQWRSFATDGTTAIQAWTASAGTIEPDQFIQIRRTTSTVGGATVTAVVTINGFTQSVELLTASIPSLFLIQGATAGRFVDPVVPPAGVNRITWRGKFFWPAGTLTNGQKLWGQDNIGCDLETLNNGWRVSVRDGTQAVMFNTVPLRHAGSLLVNTWLDIVMDVDQLARAVSLTINGVTQVYPFDNASNGLFNTIRKIGCVGMPNGSAAITAGTRFADLSVAFNGVLRKAFPNNAATANADPWKLGTGTFTNP